VTQNLALLFAELFALAGFALILHGKKDVWGLAPVLIYVAGLTAILNASAAAPVFVDAGPLRFEITNTTLVPVVLMTLLVLYVSDGTAVARMTILGIVGLSLLIVSTQASRYAHLTLPGGVVPPITADSPSLARSLPLTLASLAAFTASLATISVLYQTLTNRTRRLPAWLIVGVALLGAAAVDDIVFRLAAGGLTGIIERVSLGLPPKAISALALWPGAALYLDRVARRVPGYVGAGNRRSLDLLFGRSEARERELHATELKHRRAEARLRAVVSQAPVVVYSIDTEGTFLMSEGAGLTALGLEPGEVVGQSAFELFPSEVPDLRAVLAGKTFTTTTTLGDATYDVSYAPIREHGRVIGALGIATDVTLRWKAEQALTESEMRFKSTFEQAVVGMAHATLEGQVILTNHALHEMLGSGEENLAGADIRTLIHANDLPEALEGVRQLLDGARDQYTADLRLLRRDGRVIWANGTVSVVHDTEGNPSYLTIVVEDQTERRASDEKLRQAQKMEAVGQLTGGVAHDFNNLLTVVMGSLEIALEEGGSVESHREVLQQAVAAAQRGASLTQRLLSFSRRQTLAPETVDVEELLAGMQHLLVRTLGESVKVHVDAAPDVGSCRMDRAQMETSILNLALNARDAMPEGGRCSLEARRVHRSPPTDDAAPGHFLRITVRDEGGGIPPELVDRVFEPFFTTKDVGKGSGLGLSMVYGFAQQSGGFVSVESEWGSGTAVHVHLPVTSDA
jgi:PAS domain S-box-containing protein